MRVVLFGATGLVGHGALTALLEDPQIEGVTAVVRRTTGRRHAKLHEVLHQDFTDYSGLDEVFAAAGATLFCLGTPSLGRSETEYTRVTEGYPVAAAEAALRANPGALFVYVSANRADSASSTMWIRVKGRAEEALRRVGIRAFFVRPGFIQPRRGARPSTRAQRVVYAVLAPFNPLLRRLFPAAVTDTDNIAYAMLEVLHAPDSAPQSLDNMLINQFAERGRDGVFRPRPT